MLSKILIANRGEIARRIIRTARRMGVATVAVYSDADRRALHVIEADEAVHIGPSPAAESYLRGDRIIAAALATGAQGIHPGYGFLAENADFAEAVGEAGLTFIGPSPAAMRALGGKAAAKEVAIKAGVPVVPGYQGERQDAGALAAEAAKIGYPVMIKAVAGGGGRGMRLVPSEAELAELLASAQREAEGAFGDARVLIEKVVERPRHIEVQVFGDGHGNVVHMFERDCTMQRRNQKVIEEAPAPGMSKALRAKMCAAAVKLAKAVGYEGAGTVEFLVEGSRVAPSIAHQQQAEPRAAPSVAHQQPAQLGPDARWYFIEMNTRLQVEHPVTEEITGLDLVEWQLRIAAGEPLPLTQDSITMRGHAIEVRLCAEDPARGYLPSIGEIAAFEPPTAYVEGLRLETGVTSGSAVSPYYDSMIAKLIGVGRDRDDAIEACHLGLQGTLVFGLETNAAFLANLLRLEAFRTADMDTGLIGRTPDLAGSDAVDEEAVLVGLYNLLGAGEMAQAGPNAWGAVDGFQLGPPRRRTMRLAANGHPVDVEVEWTARGLRLACGTAVLMPPPSDAEDEAVFAHLKDGTAYVLHELRHTAVAWPSWDASALDDGDAGDVIRAPINGKVARVFVQEGDTVAKGDRVAVVEAMKMEHVLHAARDGTIARVAVAEGAQVTQGTLVASLAEVAAAP